MKNIALLIAIICVLSVTSCTKNEADVSSESTDNIIENVCSSDTSPETVVGYDTYIQWLDKEYGISSTNSKRTEEASLLFEKISCIGDFEKLEIQGTSLGSIYQYSVSDANKFSFNIVPRNKTENDNSTEYMTVVIPVIYDEGIYDKGSETVSIRPKLEIEESNYDDLRFYKNKSVLESATFDGGYIEIEGVRYLYDSEGELGVIFLYIGEKVVALKPTYTNDTNLSDYPTDGEETFISRLLSADTVASAKAELEKCILGE